MSRVRTRQKNTIFSFSIVCAMMSGTRDRQRKTVEARIFVIFLIDIDDVARHYRLCGILNDER
jgi:hypothetical protein